jgi:hypothetical protein
MRVVEARRPAFIRRSLATFPVLVFTVFGACSANNGPKYPNLNSFCNARASAECSPEVLLACASPSAATCTARRQQVCVQAAPVNATYVPSSAEACVSQVSNVYADAKVTLDESNAIDAACTVFDGRGAKDAACLVDVDCQESTGLRCVLSPGSTQGTCQVPQTVQGGGSCAARSAQCVTGFHCGPTAHCDIDAATNEACNAQNPCGPGLLCSTSGICIAKAPDGSPCAAGADCLHGICNKSSTAATGLCVSQVTLSPDEPFCVESR